VVWSKMISTSANPSHENNLRMIEGRKYCIDILNQINAIKGALGRVEERILRKHFENCVTEALQGTSDHEKQEKLDEILDLINKTRRR